MEAREFSSGTNYAKGDLCMYQGVLYRFTAAHSAGVWTGTDAAKVDDSQEQDLTRIIAGMDNADKAANYADTIVLTPSQITGTRYKYIFTNAPDPRQ